jgi:hypothetical protein
MPDEKTKDPGKCSDWKAWIDEMPPGRRLHVQGKCEYPTGGWKITLEKASPQGINPAVLIIRKVAKAPQGAATQQITTYEPKYEQKLGPDEKYDQVTIVPDNVTVAVKVIS